MAIENARLYDTSRRWARQLDSLNELGAALVAELDLDRLLEVVADRLRELLGARVVIIDLRLPDGSLRVEGASGEGAGRLVGTISPEGSKSHHVLRRMRSERVDSALEDPEIHPEGEAQMLDVQAGLWVPLVVRGEPIGVITAADKLGRDPRFSDEDLRLAEAFGSRAAGRGRAHAAGQPRHRALDAPGPGARALAALPRSARSDRSGAGGPASRPEFRQTARRPPERPVRRSPTSTGSSGRPSPTCAASPSGCGRRRSTSSAWARRSSAWRAPSATARSTEVSVTTTLSDEHRLPAEIETAVYRIVQEAAANAVRHGGARRVDVTVVTRPDAVIASIEDNGCGFDPAEVAAGRLGLAGMRERAGLFNGHLRIESAPGHGATVTVELPLVS